MIARRTSSTLPNNPSPKGGNQQILGTKGTSWGGKVTSEMGLRTNPVTGAKGDSHRGMDIASPRGTPLTANVAGKVIASGNAKNLGYSSTYGNIVVVQDANGVKHLYAHLDSASVKIGSQVKKGTVMGKVGSTGNSTGPHVHYEASKNGALLNPRNYI